MYVGVGSHVGLFSCSHVPHVGVGGDVDPMVSGMRKPRST